MPPFFCQRLHERFLDWLTARKQFLRERTALQRGACSFVAAELLEFLTAELQFWAYTYFPFGQRFIGWSRLDDSLYSLESISGHDEDERISARR
jgi:hypothetical protein